MTETQPFLPGDIVQYLDAPGGVMWYLGVVLRVIGKGKGQGLVRIKPYPHPGLPQRHAVLRKPHLEVVHLPASSLLPNTNS